MEVLWSTVFPYQVIILFLRKPRQNYEEHISHRVRFYMKMWAILQWNDDTSVLLACENIRFSSLFAAGTMKSEEKRMFSQATVLRDF